MSRRRKPRTPVTSSTPPNDGTPLGGLSDAELLREVARRRLAKGKLDIDAIEELATAAQRDLGEETLAAAIAALPPEDDKPKACPKCKQLVPVKAKNRVRHILTTAGELRLSRNYHHCSNCGLGFSPRDSELNLPEEGEVSAAMERRILDFGVNDTIESVAERWSIHFPTSISANLVRRVVDRAGLRCESAYSDEALQLACKEKPAAPPSMLTVATDGSMLLTREENWREAKAGVVARGLPVGSGIVESAHRHVLQVRMKRAGQRWGMSRARRMVRLRAVYRTAGPVLFHRAIRDGLAPPPGRVRLRRAVA